MNTTNSNFLIWVISYRSTFRPETDHAWKKPNAQKKKKVMTNGIKTVTNSSGGGGERKEMM